MHKKHILIMTLAGCIVALGLTAAMAFEGPGEGRPGMHGMFENLTPEQQELVTTLFKDFRETRYRLSQELTIKQSELNLMIVDENASDADIQAKIDEISDIQGEMLKAEVSGKRTLYLETGIILPDHIGQRGRHEMAHNDHRSGPGDPQAEPTVQ